MLVFSRFLGYFAEVARQGSIRRASDVLNISASAIDRQILRAEDELGTVLFERIPGGLRLTAAGELLLQAAQDWEKDYTRLQAHMADLRGLRRGRVRVAGISALSKGLVPETIAAVQAEFPGISFTLRVFDNVEIAAALTAQDIDFGFMLNPQPTRDLQVRAHAPIDIGVVCHPGHSFAGLRSLRISHCEGEAMVMPHAPLAIEEVTRGLLAASGVTLRVNAEVNDVQMIKAMVQAQVGISILTWLDVMHEVKAGDLAFIPLNEAMVRPMNLALCVVPYRQLSAAASLVLGRFEALLPGLSFQEHAASRG